MSFKGQTKVLSHIFTILIDSLSQPCDLFEFRLFIMDRISSSLIFNDESRLSVLMVRGGKVLVFDNGVHCDAKNLLKSSAFFEKFEIISPFTNRGGIEGIFLLLRKRFNIFQYVLGAVSGLLSFLLNSLIYFSLAAKIILVHSFDLVSAFSKSVNIFSSRMGVHERTFIHFAMTDHEISKFIFSSTHIKKNKIKNNLIHSFFIKNSNIFPSFNVLIFFVNLRLKCSYYCSHSFMF